MKVQTLFLLTHALAAALESWPRDGVPRNPDGWLLAVSRRRNPDCDHHLGDMRTIRLGRRFDAVFVHDAVAYMTTDSDLSAAVSTAFEHCRPGGLLLVAPKHFRESGRAHRRRILLDRESL